MAALDDAQQLQHELAVFLAGLGMTPDPDDEEPESDSIKPDPTPIAAAPAEPEPAPGVTVKVRFFGPDRPDHTLTDQANGTDRWTLRDSLGAMLDRQAETLKAWGHTVNVTVEGAGQEHDQTVIDLLVLAIDRALIVFPHGKDAPLWRGATVQYINEYRTKGHDERQAAITRRNRWYNEFTERYGRPERVPA